MVGARCPDHRGKVTTQDIISSFAGGKEKI